MHNPTPGVYFVLKLIIQFDLLTSDLLHANLKNFISEYIIRILHSKNSCVTYQANPLFRCSNRVCVNFTQKFVWLFKERKKKLKCKGYFLSRVSRVARATKVRQPLDHSLDYVSLNRFS
jgi:hypothetical protein